MFRSDGYINLDQVRDRFLDRNLPIDLRRALRLRARKSALYYSRMRSLPDLSDKLNLPEASDAEAWAFGPGKDEHDGIREENLKIQEELNAALKRFASEVEVFVVTAGGSVVPVASEVTAINRRFSRGSGPEREWSFLSERLLTIDVAGKIDAARAAKTILMHPAEVDLSRTGGHHLQRLAETEATALALLPYQGCSVAIAEKDMPDLSVVRRLLRLSDDCQAGEDAPATRGRPRKIEAAAEAYAELFPGGHEGYTWKDVLKRLRIDGGVIVNEDTLRKAISGIESTEE